jgi:outer membrane protein assembly factor BamE (lipoprotein component of BamABCDE complex)
MDTTPKPQEKSEKVSPGAAIAVMLFMIPVCFLFYKCENATLDAHERRHQEATALQANIDSAVDLKGVVYGMTADQVRDSWGEPLRKDHLDAGRHHYDTLYYSGDRIVTLTDGRVNDVETH